MSQISKLSKRQLAEALKDAIRFADESDKVQTGFDPQTLKTVVADAVRSLKQELMDEQNQKLSILKNEMDQAMLQLNGQYLEMRHEIETEIIQEMKDKENRRNNLIVFGLSESQDNADGENHDTVGIRNLLDGIGENSDDKNFPVHFRLGRRSDKIRPVKLVFDSFDEKQRVMKAFFRKRKNDAKFMERVFVKPDLTLCEQMEERRLRIELKARKESGENAIIRRGRIVQ